MKSILRYAVLAALVIGLVAAGAWAANPDKVAFTNVSTTPASTWSPAAGPLLCSREPS